MDKTLEVPFIVTDQVIASTIRSATTRNTLEAKNAVTIVYQC